MMTVMMSSDTGGGIDGWTIASSKTGNFLPGCTALYWKGYMDKITPSSPMNTSKDGDTHNLLDWHLTELFEMDKEKKLMCELGL